MALSHPMKKTASRREVAQMVVFLLSDDSSLITCAFYPIDGGDTAR
ncbi:SDR family oxidoreductase [Yersinia frederiksenii]